MKVAIRNEKISVFTQQTSVNRQEFEHSQKLLGSISNVGGGNRNSYLRKLVKQLTSLLQFSPYFATNNQIHLFLVIFLFIDFQ